MFYFVLTTLSTVGYGDYYPVSTTEMVVTSIVMLGGVAFFSYIMSNFIEILSSYDAKMGTIDKSDYLNDWIISLERFISKNSVNINNSLILSIINDQNYIWDNDRLSFNDKNNKELNLLPSKIKSQMITGFLFKDII